MESDTRALAAIIFLIGPVKLYRGIFLCCGYSVGSLFTLPLRRFTPFGIVHTIY